MLLPASGLPGEAMRLGDPDELVIFVALCIVIVAIVVLVVR